MCSCHRLNLTVLAFLWQRDQAELLCEMVEAPVEAVLIKIAGIGLVPNHLGKSLGEMEPILNNLNSKYGAHVCGEGGEYETYTLDCPLFHSRISLEETAPTHHHESSSIAPVAYLRLQSAKLCPKPISVPNLDTVTVPPLFDPESIEAMGKAGLCQVQAHIVPTTPDQSLHNTPSRQSSVSAHDDWVIIASIFGSSSSMPSDEIEQTLEIEVEKVFDRLEVILAESSLTFMDIAHINLHLSSMAYFSEVNRVYTMKFGTSPPTRACVANTLTANSRVMLDAIVRRPSNDHNHQDRVALHVQSRSYWAPANIGGIQDLCLRPNWSDTRNFNFPYAIIVLGRSCFIFATCPTDSGHFPSPQWIESIVCYMTDMSYLDQARKVWEHTQSYDKDIPLLFLEVLELPKGALVEWQFIAGTNQNSGDRDDNESNSGPRYICGRQPAFYGCHSQPSKALTVTGTVTNDPIISIKLPPHHPTYIQGFYSSQITADEAERRIKASFNLKEENEVDCAMSLVRVSSIGLNTGPADLDIGFHMMGLLL
ncbi:hypothetical protein PSTT_07875, partial [Puccinia striiformis]